MNFEVVATGTFHRKVKTLAKKHTSLRNDLAPLIASLASDPTQGTSLGMGCYKIRVAIKSKGKGKSGGARIITYMKKIKRTVYLLDIYDKSDQDTLSDKEMKALVNLLAEQ